MRYLISLIALLFIGTAAAGGGVAESARKIPLAYDVDVVVVGGSTRAVAAAVAAKKAGAKVVLLAQRPYLGADMCATYRLWLEEGEKPITDLAKSIYEKGTPTPLRVKRVLDDVLIAAEIPFLYGCYPTDVLRDSRGSLAGIVMANRSGRQAVRARVVIDATDRGVVARIAGCAFFPYPKGKHRSTRLVIGGTPNKDAKELPTTLMIASDSRRRRGPPKEYKVYEYAVSVDMPDASWASFAKADQVLRDRSWQVGQVDASERVYQIPPDPVKSEKAQAGPWSGAAQVDLDALRPGGTDGIYLLGGCAEVSREAADKILRPCTGMELGEIVGRAAKEEAEARQIGLIDNLVVAGKKGGRDVGALGEMLNGLRSKPTLTTTPTVKSPERSIPVLATYDVVVVGGGTGGAPAGVAAARAGAKTLVIEYLDGLGGVMTLGRIAKYYHGNRVGFTTEIDKGVGKNTSPVEHKMEWFRKEIVKAGGDIWFLSLGCGSVLKDKRFVGVVIATPEGRGVVMANTVIDATGNSVIPACAGVPCQEIGGDHISVQGTGLPTFAPGVGYLNGDWSFNDDSDVLDMWRMFVVGKHKVTKDKPSFQNAWDHGQLITTRARRRIIGDIVITPMDVINERRFPDVITVSKSNFDNHGFSSHDLFMIIRPRSRICNLPYRALMPKGYDGLLSTGLGISAHGDSMPVLRMQPDVQNHGYAAGHAAAMAAKGKTTVRKIDVKKLQKHLVEKGIIKEEMLSWRDSYPISDEKMKEAVTKTATDDSGIPVILTDPARAIPMMKSAYKSAADDKAKLRYAHVLGILGDNTGTDTLIEAVAKAEWDKGWNFRGMGQYGPTTSYVDNLVIALGRTRDKRGVDAILRMVGKLTPASHFSHCRAVSMALETVKDKRGAKPLAKLLKQEGMMGHAFTEIRDEIARTPRNFADTSTRNKSLKELILARALYRCGDHEGLGKKILTQYANDLRGHYATHAKAILSEKK